MFNNLYLLGQIDGSSLVHLKDKRGNSVIKLQLNTIASNDIKPELSKNFMVGCIGGDSHLELINALKRHKDLVGSVLKSTIQEFANILHTQEDNQDLLHLSKIKAYGIADVLDNGDDSNNCFKTANLREVFGEHIFKNIECNQLDNDIKRYDHDFVPRSQSSNKAHIHDDNNKAWLWALKHFNDDHMDVTNNRWEDVLFEHLINNQENYNLFLDTFITRLNRELEHSQKVKCSLANHNKLVEVANEQGQFVSLSNNAYRQNSLNHKDCYEQCPDEHKALFQKLDEEDLYLANQRFVKSIHQQVQNNRLLCRNKNTKCFSYKVVITNHSANELSVIYRILKTHSHINVLLVGSLIPEHQIFGSSSDESIIQAKKFAFYQDRNCSNLKVAI